MHNPTTVYKSVRFKGLGDDVEAKAELSYQRRKERKLRRKERKMEERQKAEKVRDFLQYFAVLIQSEDTGEIAADSDVFRPLGTTEAVESVIKSSVANAVIHCAKKRGLLDPNVGSRQAAQALLDKFDSWKDDKLILKALDLWMDSTIYDGWYSTGTEEVNLSISSDSSESHDSTLIVVEGERMKLDTSLQNTINTFVNHDTLIRIRNYYDKGEILKARDGLIRTLFGHEIDGNDFVATREAIEARISETAEAHRADFERAILWLTGSDVREQERDDIFSTALTKPLVPSAPPQKAAAVVRPVNLVAPPIERDPSLDS